MSQTNNLNSKNLEKTIRIDINAPLLLVVVLILFVIRVLEPFDGWTYLLTGFGGLLIISFYWVKQLADELSFSREQRFGWAQVGDLVEERCSLRNTSWLPAFWIEIHDHSTMPGYSISTVRSVDGKTDIHWRSQGLCTRRGVFQLGRTSIITGDPFGIFTLKIEVEDEVTMLVTPPILSIAGIQITPGGYFGVGQARFDAPEKTVASSSIREYRTGDSYRWIHWRLSAKHNERMVRIFEGTPTSDIWIFLDLNREHQFGAGHKSTTEHGIILTASISDAFMREGKRVGVVASGTDQQGVSKLIWLSPNIGEEHRWRILKELTTIEPGNEELNNLISQTSEAIGYHTSVIVITADRTDSWQEKILELRQDQVAVNLLLFDIETYIQEQDRNVSTYYLDKYQIPYEFIRKPFFDRPDARPGRAGHMEGKITPHGRYIPIRLDAPVD